MARQERDGNKNDVKSDKFRNSEFEVEGWDDRRSGHFSGVTLSGVNTIGGKWAENRGHRTADGFPGHDGPFEDGKQDNWNHRQSGDVYARGSRRNSRPQGGGLIGTGRDHTGRGPKGYTRSDERICDDVCDTLNLAPVDASDIDVRVDGGVVYLTGTVDRRPNKVLMEELLDGISGVRDVQNQIKVKRSGEDHEGTKH